MDRNMPIFRFVLQEGAEARDTAHLRLSDETVAREMAERMALAVSRRRPSAACERAVVVSDDHREPLAKVAVPQLHGPDDR